MCKQAQAHVQRSISRVMDIYSDGIYLNRNLYHSSIDILTKNSKPNRQMKWNCSTVVWNGCMWNGNVVDFFIVVILLRRFFAIICCARFCTCCCVTLSNQDTEHDFKSCWQHQHPLKVVEYKRTHWFGSNLSREKKSHFAWVDDELRNSQCFHIISVENQIKLFRSRWTTIYSQTNSNLNMLAMYAQFWVFQSMPHNRNCDCVAPDSIRFTVF